MTIDRADVQTLIEQLATHYPATQLARAAGYVTDERISGERVRCSARAWAHAGYPEDRDCGICHGLDDLRPGLNAPGDRGR